MLHSQRLDVPPEILGEIFTHTVADCKLAVVSGQLQALCLVCGTWRSAALANHSLWARVDIGITQTSSWSKVKSWISRAGSIPRELSIGLARSVGAHDLGCPLNNTALVQLLAQQPIKRLSLRCESMECLARLFKEALSFDVAQHPVRYRLESLHLDAGYEWTLDDMEGPTIAQLPFPHLPQSITSLDISLPSLVLFPDSAEPQPLALPNLTHLQLLCGSESWILKSLAGSPNLETVALNWDGRRLQTPNPGLGVPLTLAKLRSLRLVYLSFVYKETSILRSLACPSLTDLDIEFGNCYDEEADEDEGCKRYWFAGHLFRFVERFNRPSALRRFRLCSLGIEGLTLLAILFTLHSPKHLTLENLLLQGPLLDGIADGSILLELEVLELLEMKHDKFDYEKLYQLFKARNPQGISGSKGSTQGSSNPVPLRKMIVTTVADLSEIPIGRKEEKLVNEMKRLGADVKVQIGSFGL